jgi:hypothetical protein
MTPEGKIEAHLKKRVKALGGEVRKMRWIGRRNAPDRLVMLPVLAVWIEARPVSHLFVELKAPGKKATSGQLREHERLRQVGFVVLVLDSTEAIDAVFEGRT